MREKKAYKIRGKMNSGEKTRMDIGLKSTRSKPLEIVYIPVENLKPLPGNPRKEADERGVSKLKGLIRRHGFQNPIQVFHESNGTYTVLCGNHRMQAGKEIGMLEFPCIIYSGNRKEAMARAISDNESMNWTEWDLPKLKMMVSEIGDLDTEMSGFDKKDLEELLRKVDMEREPVLTYDEYLLGRVKKKSHVLLSFPPEKMVHIKPLLDRILEVEGIEIEQSSN